MSRHWQTLTRLKQHLRVSTLPKFDKFCKYEKQYACLRSRYMYTPDDLAPEPVKPSVKNAVEEAIGRLS